MNNDKPKRVLVTGATGFLGGNILKALSARADVIPIAACRRRDRLPPSFTGEVRLGDLMDAPYRQALVRDVDVICHTASFAAIWGHKQFERRCFYEPTRDLMEQAIRAGVRRFIQTSTSAIGEVGDGPHDDFAPTRRTGFWPHLDFLIDLDDEMRANANRGTQMVTLRLGVFIGAGNRLGLLPALVPRLRTYLVPWLARGRKHIPLIGDTDLGAAFALAAVADGLADYESFNISGPSFPTLREAIDFIADETGLPRPLYSVPYWAGYAFGGLMEALHPLLPGSSPFLTRSIVHLCEDWICPNDYAHKKLGYTPSKDWRTAMREQLAELKGQGYPWVRLARSV